MNHKHHVIYERVTAKDMNDLISKTLNHKPVGSKDLWRGFLYALPFCLAFWSIVGVVIWMVTK